MQKLKVQSKAKAPLTQSQLSKGRGNVFSRPLLPKRVTKAMSIHVRYYFNLKSII